jgi:hypothetical protein
MPTYNYTSNQLNITLLSANISTKVDNETIQSSSSGTIICSNATEATTENYRTSNDALLYIVTVLLFYSLSMVILMIKYIRREREEAEIAHYYSEYVSREKFKTPKFELQNYMKLLKYKQEYLSERSRAIGDIGNVECVNVPLVTDVGQTDEHKVAKQTSRHENDDVSI